MSRQTRAPRTNQEPSTYKPRPNGVRGAFVPGRSCRLNSRPARQTRYAKDSLAFGKNLCICDDKPSVLDRFFAEYRGWSSVLLDECLMPLWLHAERLTLLFLPSRPQPSSSSTLLRSASTLGAEFAARAASHLPFPAPWPQAASRSRLP